jgi:hypothetical protein
MLPSEGIFSLAAKKEGTMKCFDCLKFSLGFCMSDETTPLSGEEKACERIEPIISTIERPGGFVTHKCNICGGTSCGGGRGCGMCSDCEEGHFHDPFCEANK